jgi:hypothetical protein
MTSDEEGKEAKLPLAVTCGDSVQVPVSVVNATQSPMSACAPVPRSPLPLTRDAGAHHGRDEGAAAAGGGRAYGRAGR